MPRQRIPARAQALPCGRILTPGARSRLSASKPQPPPSPEPEDTEEASDVHSPHRRNLSAQPEASRPCILAATLLVLAGFALTFVGVAVQVTHAVLHGGVDVVNRNHALAMHELIRAAALVAGGLAMALSGWVTAQVFDIRLPLWLRPQQTVNLVMTCLTVFGFAAVACQSRAPQPPSAAIRHPPAAYGEAARPIRANPPDARAQCPAATG